MKKVSLEEQITEVNQIIAEVEYTLKKKRSPQQKRSVLRAFEFWTNILESLNQLQELTSNQSPVTINQP
jgi:hypothetical protein